MIDKINSGKHRMMLEVGYQCVDASERITFFYGKENEIWLDLSISH